MLLVLGSINIDLTTAADEIPRVGETVIGNGFHQYPGGKGANQAVCAARLRADVCFLGKAGKDAHGDFMLGEMKNSGVDVSHIERSDGATGMAAISVDARGRNSIIVVPGANFSVDRAYIDRHAETVERCDILLAQHETPIPVTEYAFGLAKREGKTTILNPAPAGQISDAMIRLTDILVPNEHELERLTGLRCRSERDLFEAAGKLRLRGVRTVIVTVGAQGVLLLDGESRRVFPAHPVTAVDTTAAGDSFLGGFAASYLRDRDMEKAIAFGQLAASYSVQHKGAQSSMPAYEQLAAYRDSLS